MGYWFLALVALYYQQLLPLRTTQVLLVTTHTLTMYSLAGYSGGINFAGFQALSNAKVGIQPNATIGTLSNLVDVCHITGWG